eukprot:Skav206879  [mRNA]  locus=scaffold5240:8878:10023:+ [translate_table: standard]
MRRHWPACAALAVLASCIGIISSWKILGSWLPCANCWNLGAFAEEKLWVPQESVDRVAILIAGTLRRFSLNADMRLVAPLTRANITVDVFLSLFDGPSKGWKDLSNAFQQDPQFDGLNRSGIQSLLERRFSMPGSRLVVNKVFDEYHETSEDAAFVDRNKFWPNGFGSPKEQGRIARSNFILLWKELESLWYLAQVEEHLHGHYSYVMILRDDAFWLQDFNLTKLLDLGGVTKPAAGSGDGGRLYSMLCERSEGGAPSGVIDYVLLLDRAAAESFGKCYSRLTWPTHFGKDWFTKYENDEVGPISETFYLILARFADIQVIEVPASLMPMERVGWLDGRMCLHKYCDSHLERGSVPWLNPDMPLCKKMQKKKWNDVDQVDG